MKRMWLAGIAMLMLIVSACGVDGVGGGGGTVGGGTPYPPSPSTTYTVTYDGNNNTSGSVPVDSTNYTQNQTVTVRGNTGSLVRTGYTFSGWNTQDDGNGTTYQQNDSFTMGTANVTLYARWTANSTPTYTVTYDGNNNTSGSVPVDSTNYTQNQTVTVRGNTGSLVRTGYTFNGWNTQENGSGITYTQDQTFTMGTTNVTLYAMWTVIPTYTVTYYGNNNTSGSVPVDSTNYTQGQLVTVLPNSGNLARTGFTFNGWNTQANGSGDTYTQGQTFSMGTTNVTLYAMWTANLTYTVTYNGNGSTGGSVPVDSTNYMPGQTVTVMGNTGNLVRTGYTFNGWNTQANGSGDTYTQGQAFTMGTANVTLYAMWNSSGGRWVPQVTDTWQWQLMGTLNTSYNVNVYDIDLFDTSADTIKSLHDQGRRVVCYFSAGSYENWRPDEGDFLPADLGNNLDGWPGERWLDIRSANVRNIMAARLDLAVQKGCDGVEPDNVDGYTNSTGFPLTSANQLNYNQFLATEAHNRNLAIALKNDVDQLAQLEPYFDFTVNEECHQYTECGGLSVFIAAGKPVFNAEYASKYVNNTNGARDSLCSSALASGMHTLVLPLDLDDSYRYSCD